MLQKWSQKQDVQLAKLVIRHGTTDWNLIRKQFKSARSRDSVIKRWHGKLKYETNSHFSTFGKTKQIIGHERKPIFPKRRSDTPRTNFLKIRTTRSNTIRISKNNRNNRFQRLRNFLEGTKTTRSRKAKQQKPQLTVQKIVQINDSGNSINSLPWNKSNDVRLRSLVINEGIMKWQKIANMMGCSEDQAMERWRNKIYSTIKLEDKVGGFLKYSVEEDNILTIGNKSGLSWQDLMTFLPGRSQFSIEARWRRLVRPQLQIELSKNKHYIMRQLLKKVVEKRQNTYVPLQETISQQTPRKTS